MFGVSPAVEGCPRPWPGDGARGALVRSREAPREEQPLLMLWSDLKHLECTEACLPFVPLMCGHWLQQRQREDEGAQVGLLSLLFLLLLLLASSFPSACCG